MPDQQSETPMQSWHRRFFYSAPRAAAAVLILIGIAINFANVISRYVFNFALFWAEEVMVFLIVWCVFIGAIAVAWRGEHLRMDLLSARIGGMWRRAVNAVMLAVFVVGGIFVAIQSWRAVSLFADGGDVSVTASIPMTIPHAALLIGVLAMVAAVLVRWRAYLRNRFEED